MHKDVIVIVDWNRCLRIEILDMLMQAGKSVSAKKGAYDIMKSVLQVRYEESFNTTQQ